MGVINRGTSVQFTSIKVPYFLSSLLLLSPGLGFRDLGFADIQSLGDRGLEVWVWGYLERPRSTTCAIVLHLNRKERF